ncbi:MAG: hypothetical protein GTO00_00870 [Deltaproteobacteria bacterium]|nr:hypothetical protein [Deltaproteobacteria bacterium]
MREQDKNPLTNLSFNILIAAQKANEEVRSKETEPREIEGEVVKEDQ